MRTGSEGTDEDVTMNDSMHRIRRLVEAWYREHGVEEPAPIDGTPSPAHDLTLLIPTLGRDILREALASIASSTVLPAEVVLVHQGDDPRVRDWAREHADLRVTYVQSDQRGVSAARNTGLAQVRTRFVAITDDDCVVRRDWVASVVQRLRSEPERLVTGRVEPVGDQKVVVTSRRLDVQRRPRLRSDLLGGFNMAGALRVFRRVGPFDEDPCLSHAEDKEYAYRALRTGVAITYDPDIVVGHVAWRSETATGNQYDGYARSLAGFYGKYLRRGDGFIALRTVLHFLRSSRRWFLGVLRRDPDQTANGRAYVLGLLPGLIAGWRSGG